MPGRPPPTPPNPRRRFLVALGFGATNLALARAIGSSGSVDEVTGNTVGGDANGRVEPAPGEGTTSTTAPALSEPPALADAGPEVDLATHVFDLVIRNGRVIDPSSGFDGVIDVGINGGVITAITRSPMTAGTEIDATGHIVSPGFIDILSYEPNPFGVWFKVADGVTTNLAMHGVNNYANAFFSRYEGSTPIHYGGAFHQHFMRGQEIEAAPDRELEPTQIASFVELTRDSLADGFAGVSFSPEYSPATSRAEIDALAGVAAEFGHVAFFHTRSSAPETSVEGVIEVLDLARRTGLSVHIEHFHSTGATGHMAETIDLIEQARGEGHDVTACVYPYDFWATFLQSFRFVGDWQARYGLSYGDLQVAGTEQRLDEAAFGRARADNKLVAALGSIPEQEIELALGQEWVMIGSDAILDADLNNHPRASGTFSRTLGRYHRERGVLSLVDALAKMTILPARRVEGMIPALARKGRMQRGADADITIFDPDTVLDQATVARPDQPSLGIRHVLVDGQAVMADGELRRSVLPGRPLRSA